MQYLYKRYHPRQLLYTFQLSDRLQSEKFDRYSKCKSTFQFLPFHLLLPIHRVIREAPAPGDAGWQAGLPGWQCVKLALESQGEIGTP